MGPFMTFLPRGLPGHTLKIVFLMMYNQISRFAIGVFISMVYHWFLTEPNVSHTHSLHSSLYQSYHQIPCCHLYCSSILLLKRSIQRLSLLKSIASIWSFPFEWAQPPRRGRFCSELCNGDWHKPLKSWFKVNMVNSNATFPVVGGFTRSVGKGKGNMTKLLASVEINWCANRGKCGIELCLRANLRGDLLQQAALSSPARGSRLN